MLDNSSQNIKLLSFHFYVRLNRFRLVDEIDTEAVQNETAKDIVGKSSLRADLVALNQFSTHGIDSL